MPYQWRPCPADPIGPRGKHYTLVELSYDEAEVPGDKCATCNGIGQVLSRIGGARCESRGLLGRREYRCILLAGHPRSHMALRPRGVWWSDNTRRRPISHHITHLPRGHRFELDGVSFLALGGAYSIDKPYRIVNESWWPEETITDEEMALAISGGPVDVMLTHDAPTGVNPFGPETVGNKDEYPESWQNRLRLRMVVDACTPRVLFHGHYHHTYRERLEDTGTEVIGLGRDGDVTSWRVLNPADVVTPCGDPTCLVCPIAA